MEDISSKTKPRSCSFSRDIVIRKDSSPHDTVLITEEGHEVYCHKCILVSRSGRWSFVIDIINIVNFLFFRLLSEYVTNGLERSI